VAKPNPDFRENPDRAVYVTGAITAELVDKLTPQIHALRKSIEPITVYINSEGGEVVSADRIRNLIRIPDQDGFPRRMITVVTGEAASAAADLLALGDYAIAYPNTWIVYHGTRRSLGGAVTVELARNVASSLQQTNEGFALRLARKVLGRVLLAAGEEGKGLSDYRETESSEPWPDIQPIVTAQIGDMISGEVIALARDAVARQEAIRNLTAAVLTHLNALTQPPSSETERDIEIFNAVLAYKRGQRNMIEWNFAASGLQEVTADFELLRDYHFGGQRSQSLRLLEIYGALFLTSADAVAFASLDKDARSKWLQDKVANKFRALWYYLVSCCRLLQSKDFLFDGEDAYWFGLVDEVIGCPNLVTHRMLAEQNPGPAPGPGSAA